MRLPSGFRQILKPAITAALLILVFRSVDLDSIRHNLARLNLTLILLLLLAYWAAQVVSAQRWRLWARALGMKGAFLPFLRHYFAGMFFGIGFTSLGGDIVRAYAAARHTGTCLGQGLASALLDRASGLTTLLLVGSIAIVFHPLAWRGIPLWILYALGWLAVACTVPALWRMNGRPANPAADPPGASDTGRKRRLAEFWLALTRIHLRRRDLLLIAGLSLVNSGLVIMIVERMFYVTGASLTLLAICAAVPLAEFLAMLPISVSGLGIREWSFVALFGSMGIPKDVALSVALALSGLILVRNLAGALFVVTAPEAYRAGAESER